MKMQKNHQELLVLHGESAAVQCAASRKIGCLMLLLLLECVSTFHGKVRKEFEMFRY